MVTLYSIYSYLQSSLIVHYYNGGIPLIGHILDHLSDHV